MRVGRTLRRSHRAFGPRTRAAAGALLLGLLTLGVTAGPAGAHHSTPSYTLTVSEGETTIPERVPAAGVWGSVDPGASATISIIRGGTVVYQNSDPGGRPYLSQVPQVGDVVTLESPIGRVVGSVVYDGLPSMDPTVCAGSVNFSGQNTSGFTVKGRYVTYSLVKAYHRYELNEAPAGSAQVTALSGTAFGGSFLAPLQIGQTVTAVESLETLLSEGATYTYTSENSRPVGACPAAPAPPPPPPPPPALQGSIFKLGHLTIHSLLTSGWHVLVGINQPGTIFEDLYLENGALPAFASSKKHHHRPAALLIARGVYVTNKAGVVNVLLRVTHKGRSALRSAKNVHAVLLTTIHSSSGSKMSLKRRTVKLH